MKSKNKTKKEYLKTCGFCKYFKQHKTLNRFAGGYWIGDGKCLEKDTEYKFTVVGNNCNLYKKIMK